MHSDLPNNGTRGIFDRLELNGGSDSNGSLSSSNSSSTNLTNTKITISGLQRNASSTAATASVPKTVAPTVHSAASPSSASIFKRLGGIATVSTHSTVSNQSAQRLNDPSLLRAFSGQLKRPASTTVINMAPSGGVIKKVAQKVILVKKQPAKATRPDDDDVLEIDDDDDDDGDDTQRGRHPMFGYAAMNRSGGSEKCVSFSEEDEVLEFASRKEPPPRPAPPAVGNASVHAIVPVKDRLGVGAKAETDASLHRTLKTSQPKPVQGRPRRLLPGVASSAKVAAAAAAARSASSASRARMPVHSRLTLKSGSSGASGSGRSTKPSSSVNVVSKTTGQQRASVSSVFQRLGFTD